MDFDALRRELGLQDVPQEDEGKRAAKSVVSVRNDQARQLGRAGD